MTFTIQKAQAVDVLSPLQKVESLLHKQPEMEHPFFLEQLTSPSQQSKHQKERKGKRGTPDGEQEFLEEAEDQESANRSSPEKGEVLSKAGSQGKVDIRI